MIQEAKLDRQLMVKAENQVGKLSAITRILTDHQINIHALCAYSIGDTFALMMVTDDNNGAKRLLLGNDYSVEEEEVILLTVKHEPGSLQRMTDLLAAEGVDLVLLYGSASQSAEFGRVVLYTNDNEDAMLVIKTMLERN